MTIVLLDPTGRIISEIRQNRPGRAKKQVPGHTTTIQTTIKLATR